MFGNSYSDIVASRGGAIFDYRQERFGLEKSEMALQSNGTFAVYNLTEESLVRVLKEAYSMNGVENNVIALFQNMTKVDVFGDDEMPAMLD